MREAAAEICTETHATFEARSPALRLSDLRNSRGRIRAPLSAYATPLSYLRLPECCCFMERLNAIFFSFDVHPSVTGGST